MTDVGPAAWEAGPQLHWGVKSSFVEYVAGVPGGSCELSGEATVVRGQWFCFAADESPAARPGSLHWRFRGGIRFVAHGGLLDVRLHNPWVTADAEGRAELSVVDGVGGARRALTALQLEIGALTPGAPRVGAHVRLVPSACDLFGDVYRPHEPFENLVIVDPRVRS